MDETRHANSTRDRTAILQPGGDFNGLGGGSVFAQNNVSVPLFTLAVVVLTVKLIVLFSTSCPCSCFGCSGSCGFFLGRLVFTIIKVTTVLFISGVGCGVFRTATGC